MNYEGHTGCAIILMNSDIYFKSCLFETSCNDEKGNLGGAIYLFSCYFAITKCLSIECKAEQMSFLVTNLIPMTFIHQNPGGSNRRTDLP